VPVYAYKGYDAAGKAVSGTRDADNPRTIKQVLRRDGVFITDLKETGPVKPSATQKRSFDLKRLTDRVSTEELAVATRQLATLVGAGIPLVDSLVALIDQIEHEMFKSVWADVKQKVNEGASFGDALSGHPKVFSGLYINMVRAGESSGALEVVLSRLADFTESQAELRSKLVGTMIYPIIMMLVASAVTGFLFIVVIPKISMIFESQKLVLPLPTQVLILMSTLLRDYWFILLPLIVVGIIGFRRYINSKRGRPWWDGFVLRAPIFGSLVRMVAITRFCKTLGTLLASGVPLLTAFDIVKNVVQNTVLLEVIETARDAVKEGDSIAAPLKRSGQFPPIVTHMIAIGERSGQLEPMLNNVAKSYEVQVDARLKALTSILEPVMIVFMGAVVGFMVLSILLPMLQLSSSAG
jgi:general secretion pathway protein F